MKPDQRERDKIVMSEYAQLYNALGWPVLPLYAVKDGACACGRSDCPSAGKHPTTEHGVHEATSDLETILSWPRLINLGVPMGDGLVAIDVDPRNGGDVRQLGPLPKTITAKTGGGGLHLLFQTNGHKIKNGKLGPGIDVKGEGGYIVVAPSRHATGKRYRWAKGRGPTEIEAALLPGEIAARLRKQRNGHHERQRFDTKRVLRGVAHGERDDSLFRLASKLRWADVPKGAAKRIVLDAAARCSPPFPADKAREKVRSAYERYKAGPSASRTTELANARRLVALHGEDIRYVYGWRRWAIWDGQRWRPDDSGEVGRRAKDAVRTIYLDAAAEEDEKISQQLAGWAVRSQSAHGIRAMIELAQSEDAIPLRPDDLDRDPWLLNVSNGTLDLRSGERRPHQRDDLIAKLAPVEYDPDAECPLWLAFLDRVFAGSDELIAFVRRAVGYSLTADVSEHLLFIAHGPGANGKSTFLETVAAALGDYASAAAPSLLLLSQHDRHPTELADLRGARFVHTVEVAEGRRLNEELVKKLTGGDTVKARRMREDFWEFSPTHKLWLGTNHKPEIGGTDEAIWRRIRLVPFDVTIPPRERDKRLIGKLCGELPGILAWAVRGCLDWQQRGGLGTPPEVKAATKAYRQESDVVGAFIEECCVVKEGARIPASDLYANFVLWAAKTGEEQWSKKRLGQRLRARGFTPKGDGTRRWWLGLRA